MARKEISRSVLKFIGIHTLPPEAVTRERLDRLAQAAQRVPTMQRCRIFVNLAAGNAVCLFEAPSQEALASWFQTMGLPHDGITPLELEGERGLIEDE